VWNLQWLNNPWVIGIGGGILSGAFVAFISQIIFSRRERSEYLRQVELANNEILFALKPGISEGAIPDEQLVGNLIAATARKYKINSQHAHGPKEIVEDLTKEILDSSFISSKTKLEFCKQLEPLASSKPLEQETSATGVALERVSEYRKQAVQVMSLFAGLVTGLSSMLIGLVETRKLVSLKPPSVSSSLLPILLMAAVSLLAVLSTVAALSIVRQRRKAGISEMELDKIAKDFSRLREARDKLSHEAQ
jgi:hypothetical protein